VIGIEMQRVGEAVVARPRSDIDAANAREAHDRLSRALDEGASRLVVDLAAVGYLDSAGIDMLLRLGERLRQRRAELRLAIPAHSRLMRVAEIVDLPASVPVHATVQDALEAAPIGPHPSPVPDPEHERCGHPGG
jgi:anti-anti-sigma factor